jgi:hypothetical protein
MNNEELEEADVQAEIDFSQGFRGLHYIPAGATVFMPASIERSVREYFSGTAEQKGVQLSGLLTEILRRDNRNQRSPQTDPDKAN